MSTGNGEYEKRQQQRYRKRLEDAYEAYKRREPLSLDKLGKEVYEFARRKLYNVESNPEFSQIGTSKTVDDFAQEVVFSVWKGLKRGAFRGDVSTFYSWVHKITFNQRRGFEGEILEQKYVKVPLLVSKTVEPDEKITNDRYEHEQVDNPEIHEGPAVYDIGCNIPKSTQGLDRTICNLLLTEVSDEVNCEYIVRPRNYAEVAFVLGMTESAVSKRLQLMRKRNIKDKEQEKAQAKQRRLDEENERRDSVSIGLAKLRGSKP